MTPKQVNSEIKKPNVLSLVRLFLRCDQASHARKWTPLFFALTVWLIFQFGHEYQHLSTNSLTWISEFHLALFFAAQLSVVSAFSADLEDHGLQFLQLQCSGTSQIFLAKVAVNCLHISKIWLPLLFVHSTAVITNGFDLTSVWPWISGVLTIFGLSTLGILISALTLTAKVREVLFPFLFFPFCIPILLASMESSNAFMTHAESNAQMWLWLLAGFDVIFVTLGVLLFDDWDELS